MRQVITSIAFLAALATAGCSTPGSTPIGTPKTTTTSPSAPSAAASTPASASTAPSCSPASLRTRKAGRLTVATGSPAQKPWFSAGDPSNGKGFESAVAYAVAGQLGYTAAQVTWVSASLDNVITGKPKSYDFDIDQVTITRSRTKVVDFSPAYYDVAQAVVALKTNKFASAPGTDALHGARLGARAGTTSLDAIKNQIRAAAAPRGYASYELAEQALTSGQIDGLVVELPTALHLISSKLAGAVIIGQLPLVGAPEQWGLVLAKHSPLTSCVSKAVIALDHAGTLAELQTRWLTTSAGAPVLH